MFLSRCTLSIWVHFIISLGYLCIHYFSINFHRKKKFPGRAAHQTRFTANANQSNHVACAHVAGTEVCACHRGENSFLPPWKLIFTTLEFYRECQPMKRALPGKLRAYLEIIVRCCTWLGTSLVTQRSDGARADRYTRTQTKQSGSETTKKV